MEQEYWVYMLECANGNYYTGIALDLAARYRMHRSGTGARYTRIYPPRHIVQCWRIGGGRGEAMKIEAIIKSMARSRKEELLSRPSVLTRIAAEKNPDGPRVRTVSRASLRCINGECSKESTSSGPRRAKAGSKPGKKTGDKKRNAHGNRRRP